LSLVRNFLSGALWRRIDISLFTVIMTAAKLVEILAARQLSCNCSNE